MPPPAAADVADALCALPGLRAVSMHAAPDPERCFAARALRGLCSARHAGLTRLALHLGWGTGVSRGGHGGCGVLEAVRPLTGLQALALSECRLDGEAMRQLRGAVLAMPLLHDLGLNSIKVRCQSPGQPRIRVRGAVRSPTAVAECGRTDGHTDRATYIHKCRAVCVRWIVARTETVRRVALQASYSDTIHMHMDPHPLRDSASSGKPGCSTHPTEILQDAAL